MNTNAHNATGEEDNNNHTHKKSIQISSLYNGIAVNRNTQYKHTQPIVIALEKKYDFLNDGLSNKLIDFENISIQLCVCV